MNVNVNEGEDMSRVQAGNTGVKAAVLYGAGDEQGEAAEVTAAAILKSIFTPEDAVYFRVFDNKEVSTFCRIMKLVCKCPDSLEDMEALLRGHNEMCPACPSPAITADGQLTQLDIGTSVVTYYGEMVELKETDTHE